MNVRTVSFLVAATALIGCDAPKMPAGNTTATSGRPAPPFVIEPKVWGATTAEAKFEVRELPDGTPGLFDADGALLVELLPELVVDAGALGKPRPKPTTRRFELIKLTPGDDGGFTMFARLKDQNARAYDLRIENGPHDPRIHVGVSARWARDVTVHRLLVRFRTGPIGDAEGLGHDLEWTAVDEEWVGPLHSPTWARFGDRLTVHGRTGTENVALRQVEDRWDLELELYHHENHPVQLGEDCDTELDGAGQFTVAGQTELRADLIVGEVRVPVATRYPRGLPAAVALADTSGGAARTFVAADAVADPLKPGLVPRQGLWLGDSLEDLPCGNGRFRTLAEGGITTMWSGETMVSSGANLLAPTETDARRAFAFTHPGIAVPTLFALSDGEPDAGWFDPSALAQLRDDRGLIVIRTPLDAFLARDASATQTVQEAATQAATEKTIWLASVEDVASRLIAMRNIDLDVLPEGVVRVRNANTADVEAVTLLAPEGTSARFATGQAHQTSGRTVWFDVAASGDQLFQLFDADAAFWAMKPADIVVSYEPSTQP